MFCKNCGSMIADDAIFCNNCGAQVGSNSKPAEMVDDNAVLLTAGPVFKIGYEIVRAILNSFVATVAILILLGINVMLFIPIWIFMLVFYLVKIIFDKLPYKNMEFKFYRTKVEYIDGFLNKERKEVKYKNIKEVTATKNILERMFGLGKIKLHTNVEFSRNGKGTKNGIVLHCLKDVDGVARQINELLDSIENDE